jgi:hypothetical protein
LLGVLAGMGFFYWMASSIGWSGAWFVFWVFVLMAVGAFLDLLRAHRAWKIANAIRIGVDTPGTRFNTVEKRQTAETDEDRWPKP